MLINCPECGTFFDVIEVDVCPECNAMIILNFKYDKPYPIWRDVPCIYSLFDGRLKKLADIG